MLQKVSTESGRTCCENSGSVMKRTSGRLLQSVPGSGHLPLTCLAVGDFVGERMHVDPEFAAAVEGEACVQTLGIFGDLANDRLPGPVHGAADGLAACLFVLSEQVEVGTFRSQIGPNV